MLLLSLPLMVLLGTAYSEVDLLSKTNGDTRTFSSHLTKAMHAILAELRLGMEGEDQSILRLRLIRALCAIGVGGSLALAGAMAQGLFRNPLADPGLLGVNSGAMLGAVLGIATVGGHVTENLGFAHTSVSSNLAIVPVLSFIGALVTAFSIYWLAVRHGRISIPGLLLTGLAVNALLGAVMATMQVLLLPDWQVSRAILSWTFGTLDDRNAFHLTVVFCGAFIALASIPFISLELDLMAGGEENAAALGADPVRIKNIVLISVALATAAAVSVCGQVAFVGLLVPHVMRTLVGPHHRTLLPLSFLAGAALLLGVIVIQHVCCPLLSSVLSSTGSEPMVLVLNRATAMQPGMLMSLLGAPFFLYLLLRQGRQFRI